MYIEILQDKDTGKSSSCHRLRKHIIGSTVNFIGCIFIKLDEIEGITRQCPKGTAKILRQGPTDYQLNKYTQLQINT